MKKGLLNKFGNIDIYVFDQLLKGRFDNAKNVLDVGCGTGRNLLYLKNNNINVCGVDQSQEALSKARNLLGEDISLQIAKAEELPFKDGEFDVVICSAVLHFAKDDNHFNAMLNELWRVLKNGGMLFTRIASSEGIEELIKPLGNNRFNLPDGSDRYLINDEVLLSLTKKLNAKLLDPIKTTNVQGKRCMTTWVLEK